MFYMLQRMKKIWKKEKGFTLVELLAVIVILGIILAIAIPAVGNVIKNSEAKADKANWDLFESAARMAYLENPKTSYNLQDLYDGGYLNEIPEDPVTGGKYSGSVEVSNDGKTFKYSDRKDTGG